VLRQLEQIEFERRTCETEVGDCLVEVLREECANTGDAYAATQLKAELEGVTDSFADMKRRYDEAKGLIESLRKNEATLVEALHKAEESCAEAEARFDALRVHAEEKLAVAAAEVKKTAEASQQAESARQAVEAEQNKLVAFWQARALIAEAKLPGLVQTVASKERENEELAQTVASKERENQELVAICDQLFASLQPTTTGGGSSSSEEDNQHAL
jgi:predicted nuclease with TOPRIM domain